MTEAQRILFNQRRCIWCAAPSRAKECAACRQTQKQTRYEGGFRTPTNDIVKSAVKSHG